MMEWVMDGRMDCKDGSDEGNSEYIIGFHVLRFFRHCLS